MGNYKLIPLSRKGIHRGYFARVSPEDYERIAQFNWCVCFEGSSRKAYAVRFVKDDRRRRKGKRSQVKIKMHREVLRLPPYAECGLVAHHKDGDGLNNTRENLAPLTYEENCAIKIFRKREEPWL